VKLLDVATLDAEIAGWIFTVLRLLIRGAKNRIGGSRFHALA
jgi:hypothetical protein